MVNDPRLEVGLKMRGVLAPLVAILQMAKFGHATHGPATHGSVETQTDELAKLVAQSEAQLAARNQLDAGPLGTQMNE